MDDNNTSLIINLISLGLLVLNIGLYVTLGKELIKNKTMNTVAWFVNLALCIAAVVGFFTDSVVSISCSGAALLLISVLILRKYMTGKKLKGDGLRSYRRISSTKK